MKANISLNLYKQAPKHMTAKTSPATTMPGRRAAKPASSVQVARKPGRAAPGSSLLPAREHAPEPAYPGTAAPARSAARGDGRPIAYRHTQGVDAFVRRVARATPMEMVEVERHGIDSVFLKDLSRHMHIPAVRMFHIVGVPKATAEKKVAANEPITGSGGQAALGLARLLAIAQGIVDNSTAAGAANFDVAKWLGQWIERPQPALGGRKPADLVGTPTGLDMVARVLGAIESGAYQ